MALSYASICCFTYALPSGVRLLYFSRCSDVKPDGADELDEELDDEPCPQAEIDSAPTKIKEDAMALFFIKFLSI